MIRTATPEDIPVLITLRKRQLVDEGITPDQDIDNDLHRFFATRMRDDTLVEWVKEEDGHIIATAAIVFYDFPPACTNVTGMKGYITNMYTHPDYRRPGIATQLLTLAVEEAKARGVAKLWLGASRSGRPVYEAFGFHGSEEWMEMTL